MGIDILVVGNLVVFLFGTRWQHRDGHVSSAANQINSFAASDFERWKSKQKALKPLGDNMSWAVVGWMIEYYPNSLSTGLLPHQGTSKRYLNVVYTCYWSHFGLKCCDFNYIYWTQWLLLKRYATQSGLYIISHINILEQFAVVQYISNGFSNRYKLHSNTF